MRVFDVCCKRSRGAAIVVEAEEIVAAAAAEVVEEDMIQGVEMVVVDLIRMIMGEEGVDIKCFVKEQTRSCYFIKQLFGNRPC